MFFDKYDKSFVQTQNVLLAIKFSQFAKIIDVDLKILANILYIKYQDQKRKNV